jgi:hypothetical protein
LMVDSFSQDAAAQCCDWQMHMRSLCPIDLPVSCLILEMTQMLEFLCPFAGTGEI